MAVAKSEIRAVGGRGSYRLTARIVSAGSTALRFAWSLAAAGQKLPFIEDRFSVYQLLK